ncbi:MAG TPA: EF-hand domain-containing protein [Planctomycetota bacterium]|nr:EF-hand domain-containing protein [Planctomycetota bacterium]
MSSFAFRGLALWCLALPALPAQGGRRPPPLLQDSPRAPTREVRVLSVYDEASSRAAFHAIDANADDRLSALEFVAALEGDEAADPRDLGAFRRADADRDGFLDWPEFDARLRAAIRLNGTFRYRPARTQPNALRASVEDAENVDPGARAMLNLLDSDRNGKVSREEFAALVHTSGLPASSLDEFVVADQDSDGELDAGELPALTRRLANLPRMTQTRPSARTFSVPWRRADLDGDGEITPQELEAALRGIDVHLGRWAETVIANADRTRDGRLGPAEVVRAEGREERDRR